MSNHTNRRPVALISLAYFHRNALGTPGFLVISFDGCIRWDSQASLMTASLAIQFPTCHWPERIHETSLA